MRVLTVPSCTVVAGCGPLIRFGLVAPGTDAPVSNCSLWRPQRRGCRYHRDGGDLERRNMGSAIPFESAKHLRSVQPCRILLSEQDDGIPLP